MTSDTDTKQTCDSNGSGSSGRKKQKKAGRRRRNKKDVILDFSKHARKQVNVDCPLRLGKKDAVAAASAASAKSKKKKEKMTKESAMEIAKIASSKVTKIASEYKPPEKVKKSKRNKSGHKFTLSTSSKDYGGNLGLPEEITQREYESTGQFFRRLDRLVAKARVEANLETRFDVRLNHKSSDLTDQ